jgi:MFS transporter, DHA3 family, macrolide efflux protein
MSSEQMTMSTVKSETADLEEKKSLFQNRQFLFLWLAGAASSFSLSIYMLTEEWYVVSKLNVPSMLGIVAMLTLLPRVIFMFVGGTFADRLQRSKILFLSDFIRGGIVFLMAVIFMMGLLKIYTLMIFAFLFGILDAFYWPANSSLIPFLVPKDQLTRANSLIQGSNQIFMIGGPVVGAFLIHLVHFKGVFFFIAALLLMGSLLNLNIKEVVENANRKKKASIFADLKDTLAYMKTEPYLLTSMGTSIMINFFFSGPISVGIPILVKKIYYGSSIDLSYMEGTLAAGMCVGALLMGLINLKKKRAIANLSMIAVIDIFAMILSQTTEVWYGVVCMAFIGIILAASNVNGPSITQSIVNPKRMGRVQSLMAMTGMGLTPVSFSLVSFLLSLGIKMTDMLFVASICGFAFIIIILASVRSLWSID